jgi:protoporphyrinogen oxidase
MTPPDVILGAGMTGLSAAWASGLTVYEAETYAGGICRSYYVTPGSGAIGHRRPTDGNAYRFEVGGGHWIFGGDAPVLQFINRFSEMRRYQRKAVVFFPDTGISVPYPLQYHLGQLDATVAKRALEEMRNAPPSNGPTLSKWLEQAFGPSLTELFFGPFHEAYTAGLWTEIAPQDGYKTPIDLASVEKGMRSATDGAGYNAGFYYPAEGLAEMADRIASSSDVRYGKSVCAVDVRRRELQFQDGSGTRFDRLISTLPLDRMTALCGVDVEAPADPYTSVLVLNIGAVRGPKCPDAHWVYLPRTRSGFHRIGFYSNVEREFLPDGAKDRVSLYVERAYRGRLEDQEAESYAKQAVEELQSWDFIRSVDVLDASRVKVAYTWSRPGSAWRSRAIEALTELGVIMVGRYATWQFQGIAESIRQGLLWGATMRPARANEANL